MALAAIILVQVDMQTTVSSWNHNIAWKPTGQQDRAIGILGFRSDYL